MLRKSGQSDYKYTKITEQLNNGVRPWVKSIAQGANACVAAGTFTAA